jgi:hypothetical protein
MRGYRSLCVMAVFALAGCGGGDSPQTTARAYMPVVRAQSTALTETALFDWAQFAYAQYFNGAHSDGLATVAGYGTFSYRFWPATGNYVGVLNGAVYIYGPISANAIQRVGAVADFACRVNDCGGGGGNSGLVPVAPAATVLVTTDAASLRPLRDNAVWSYRGVRTAYTGATPVNYVTRTTQSVTGSGTAIESTTNAANEGTDTETVSIGGGIVASPQSIDFIGNGHTESVPFIEMRSPVRQGDQFVIWDRHYTDTDIDVDRDGIPDALDVALYGRVMGVDTLNLPGLPALTTVRIDITERERVIASSTGESSAVIESVIQTWYASGIGIVRQRSTSPTASGNDVQIIDEQITSWDGGTQGLGAMTTLTSVVPMTDAISGAGSIMAAAGFGDHALVVLAGPFAADSTIARLDTRGHVLSSRIQTNMPAGSRGLVVPHSQGLLYVRQLETQSGLSASVQLTRFDTDGALVGDVGGATIDLTGARTNPSFDPVKAAVDGDTLWLLWCRTYNTPTSQKRELIARPYTLDGAPLGPELLLDPVETTAQKIAGAGGRVLVTWARYGNGYEGVYASVAAGDTGVTVRSFVNGIPIFTMTSQLLLPRAAGASGCLLWTAPLLDMPARTTGGVLLDGNQNPIRAGSTPASEVLAGVPALPEVAPAVDSTPDGSQLVMSINQTVSWVGTGGSAPLSTRPVSQVKLPDATIRAHVVFADRVLVLGGDGDRLTTTTVWLNSGMAP